MNFLYESKAGGLLESLVLKPESVQQNHLETQSTEPSPRVSDLVGLGLDPGSPFLAGPQVTLCC